LPKLSFIKKQVKTCLNKSKSLLNLNTLNELESDGNFSWITRFRLLPKTKVTLPFTLGISCRGCAFVDHIDKDPFAKIVEQVLVSDGDDHIIEYLLKCYENEQKLVGETPMRELAPAAFSNVPPWAIVMPWEKISLQEKLRLYLELYKANRGMYGANLRTTQSDSPSSFLYSTAAARSQVEQTRKLVCDIRSRGIIETGDLPLVYVLRRGRQWRWCMTGEGNHRAYIFSLMGEPSMLAEVYAFVDRDRASEWPNVLNGNYTVEEALPVFDSYFEGRNCIRGVV
jgi:hypothetical protein